MLVVDISATGADIFVLGTEAEFLFESDDEVKPCFEPFLVSVRPTAIVL